MATFTIGSKTAKDPIIGTDEILLQETSGGVVKKMLASVLAKYVLGYFNTLTDKPVPVSTDIFAIQETGGGLSKKLTMANFVSYFMGLLYPVGSFYVQYPDAASNTDATAFPSALRPATMFGGTWAEQFNTEGVVFQTAGYDGIARTNGLMEDQGQGHRHVPLSPLTTFYGNTGGSSSIPGGSTYSQAATTGDPTTDTVNGTPRMGTRTAHRNRLMKVWKRTA